MDQTRGRRGRGAHPNRGRGGRERGPGCGRVPQIFGEPEMVSPLNFDCSEYIGSPNHRVLRRRRSGYPVEGRAEPAVIPQIPSMLAALILERVRPSARPVAEASTSTGSIETPDTRVSSLLTRPDEYVVGLSSPFAMSESHKLLSKKKKPTRKIKRSEGGRRESSITIATDEYSIVLEVGLFRSIDDSLQPAWQCKEWC